MRKPERPVALDDRDSETDRQGGTRRPSLDAADEAAMLLLVTLVLLMTSAQHLHNLVRISGLNHQPCHGMPVSCCCARGAVRAFPSWLTRAALPRRCSTADPRAQCSLVGNTRRTHATAAAARALTGGMSGHGWLTSRNHGLVNRWFLLDS